MTRDVKEARQHRNAMKRLVERLTVDSQGLAPEQHGRALRVAAVELASAELSLYDAVVDAMRDANAELATVESVTARKGHYVTITASGYVHPTLEGEDAVYVVSAETDAPELLLPDELDVTERTAITEQLFAAVHQ